jgi:uncharacterized protein YfaS (alpha-2-macroglobulin family)
MQGCRHTPASTKLIENPYISAYTSGVISINAGIKIRLAQSNEAYEQHAVAGKKLFKISPHVEGEAYWLTPTTIEFRPKEPLKSNQVYQVSFRVADLIPEAKSRYKTFDFSVTTFESSFVTEISPIMLQDDGLPDVYMLEGLVSTADYMDDGKIEEVLTATVANQKAKIKWEHYSAEKKHLFHIHDIASREEHSVVILRWNGKPVSYDYESSDTVKVPVKGLFEVMNVTTNQEEQYILCTFSEPLDTRQKVSAYVELDRDMRLSVSANNIYIYLSDVANRTVVLTVREGLKSKSGKTLAENYTEAVVFEDLKPAVRFAGKGVLIPGVNNFTLPFQSVNLKAVDVHIHRVFEDNVLQFLQVNNIGGNSDNNYNYEMHRVGKPVASTTVKLDEGKKVNLHRWNTFSLDLAQVITPEPGAIYEVNISFRRDYSLYRCDNAKTETNDDDMTEITVEVYDDEYEDDEYYDDGWEGRNNPCSDAYYSTYYNSGRFIRQNVIATNLGMIVKKGNGNNLTVFVNDLLTTQPMSGVTVIAYDFQQQKITEGNTDSEGKVILDYKERPYVLVAVHNNQKSYLRVDDGLSLSLSSFDVAGVELSKGINGFIYTERGVWRPGDTIFLSFILHDVNGSLPENHPVVFELYNVQNRLVNRLVQTSGKNGIYVFPSATTPDAPTGTWNAKVTVGGVTYDKSVRVATVKPNRLKIITTLKDELVTGNKNISGELSVKWLHGANAPGLKADITTKFMPLRTTFAQFLDYDFENVISNAAAPNEKSVESKLDENGVMRFDIPTGNNDDMPGTLSALLDIRVFEEGGDFSVDNASVTVMPFNSYVGLKSPNGNGYYKRLEADKDQLFEVVTVDSKGNAVTHEVEVNIYRTDWSWWWSSSNKNIANYTYSIYQNKVYATKITTDKNGKGTFKYRINKPDWGMFLVQVIDKKSGHSMSQRLYIDWWSYGRGDRTSDNANMLVFTADKEKYQVGENAVITTPSTAGARALISLETASKVLRTFWTECTDGETVVNIPITPEMTPNVYVHITLLQPHQKTTNDLPIRLYGVIPVLVEDPNTKLVPMVKNPDVIRPDEPFVVKVSEQHGKEMSYTLAIVDDGLLDLTHFKTPDPWSHFFRRQALGVRTWDLYNFVIGAYGGKIEQIFAIGGDGEFDKKVDDKQANRFKPVVKFAGPFTLKAGKTAEHTFTINNYVGSVRTMVIASAGNAYGATQQTTPVRSPLMVQATLPRVLSPGETVSLPVTVFAMENHVKNVDIKLQTNDIFEVIGGSEKNISFKNVGDEMVTFRIRTKERLGYGQVKIIATAGKERAESTIEMNVRAANPSIVTSAEQVVLGHQSAVLNLDLPGMEGTNTAELEVAGIPPLNLGTRLDYLITYPHGCLEQTTSGAFPQLHLADVVDLSDAKKKQTEENIKAALTRLRRFETSYGYFSYWPNEMNGYICHWTNNYAGHFMIEAERKGYAVSESMKTNWIAAQQKAAKNWTPESNDRYRISQGDFVQAYRLYVLALAKKPELGAMNRLKERSALSLQAKWMLAGAYSLAGQPDAAKSIIQGLPVSVADYDGSSETYGSNARDEAMILEILTLLGEKENAFLTAKRVSDALNKTAWMSTQTTAYCLMGLSKYAAGESGKLEFTYEDPSKKSQTVKSKKAIWSTTLGAQSGTKTAVKMENNSDRTLYVRLSAKGFPMAGEETAAERNLKISVRYLDENGNPLVVATLPQGTDFEAEVQITNPGLRGYYPNMALTQIFPSGWEIRENRLIDGQKNKYITYMDIRDDRVLAYFDIPASKTVTMRIKLHAAYVGTFYMPAVACEAMYDHSISANTSGRWISVE